MKLKYSFTSVILLIFCFKALAQNSIPTTDTVVFKDGSVKEGTLKTNRSQGIEFNGNVKLCVGKKNKDCVAYPIADIDHITQAPPQLIVRQLKVLKASKDYHQILAKSKNPEEYDTETYINRYKVIYNADKTTGGLAKLKYAGQTAYFYYYVKPGKNGGKTCLTKPNASEIIFSFNSTATSNKFSLKQLTEFFKDCSQFVQKSSEKNAHKKYNMLYFYKLSDICSMP